MDKQIGSLEIIFGPMFSGKTTELHRRIRRYSLAENNCIIIKFAGDVRYSTENYTVTHDQQKYSAIPCSKLVELENKITNYNVIGIDEGQFFPDIVQYASNWSSQGKIVVIAALDGTFQRKPFGTVLELVPLCENVTKLSAVCMICCKKDAHFTKRISTETKIEIIGGRDKYAAVCRECYETITNQQK